jgi:hypothetical protein
MKISASILALIAFVAIFMAVLTEARLGHLLRVPGPMPRRPLPRPRRPLPQRLPQRPLPRGQRPRWGRLERERMVMYDESVGRPSYTQGNGRTYRSNGYTMNSRGYLANPTRSAQINARNAGALTNSEARSMGLRNYRDEIANDESVGWRGAAIKYGPQAINAVRTWGPVIKHCVSAMCGGDEMEETVGLSIRQPSWKDHKYKWKMDIQNAAFDEEESVGWDDQPSHTRAQRPTGQSMSNYYNNWRL